MTSSNSVTLNARCHCGLATYSYTLSASAFPLKASICHCDDCRHSSGYLFASFAVVPASPPDVSQLTSYHSSDSLTRVFCPKCGAFVCNIEHGEWEFASGILDKTERLLDRKQMWIVSSKDGGASVWVPKELSGRKVERYIRGRDSLDLNDDDLMEIVKRAPAPDTGNKLHARCHCGAIEFYITRPADKTETKRWRIGDKYNACLCSCTSCRTCSGFDISAWTYVPLENIRKTNGESFNLEDTALAHYESSPGIHREFCRTCGAKVFFRNDSRDPQVYDVAVGLLRGGAARVEGWINWEVEMEYLDDATDKELASSLLKGMQAFYE